MVFRVFTRIGRLLSERSERDQEHIKVPFRLSLEL